MGLPAKFFQTVRELLHEEGRKAVLEAEKAGVEEKVKDNKAKLVRMRADVLSFLQGTHNVVVLTLDNKTYLIDPHRTPSDDRFIVPADVAEPKDKGK